MNISSILFIFYLCETLVSELLFVCYDLMHAESIMRCVCVHETKQHFTPHVHCTMNCMY